MRDISILIIVCVIHAMRTTVYQPYETAINGETAYFRATYENSWRFVPHAFTKITPAMIIKPPCHKFSSGAVV